MSETKFTPGPWAVRRYRAGEKHLARIVQDRRPLSRVLFEPKTWFTDEGLGSDEDVEFQANLSLIAAAPEMYEALETVAQLLRDHHADQGAEDGWQNEELRDAWVAARDVLAKAEGRS